MPLPHPLLRHPQPAARPAVRAQPGIADQALAAGDTRLDQLAQLGRQPRPVDPRVVEPYLGFYEHDYSLVRDGGHLLLLVGPRRLRLDAMPDGSYVVSEGAVPGTPVKLSLDQYGHRRLEFVGFEKVRQIHRQ